MYVLPEGTPLPSSADLEVAVTDLRYPCSSDPRKTSPTSHSSLPYVTKLKNGSIFLGNELFAMLKSKISSETKNLKEKIKELQELVNELNDENSDNQMAIIDPKLDIANRDLELLDKMKAEVLKMKCGSIALVNQITTISKIRIYDPKTDHDILSGIRLSNEKLDLIDDEIQKKFTNI